MEERRTTTYSYDAMGNLLKVILPDNRVITYKVDARGRRIAKYVDGEFKYGFIYKDQLNPIAKVDENGKIMEKYVYGLKSNIPEYVIKYNEDGNYKRYKIISDHLGSPVMVVKYFYDTEVAKELKYNSFGQIIYDSAPDFDFPFRFAGGIYDEDTKLIRFGVRDYDPETGRWMSVEPLGFSGSRNWYVYAGNDGVDFVDITGLNPFKRNSNRGFGYNPHEGACGRTFGAGISDTTSELGLKSSPVWIPAIIGMVTFGFGSAIGGTSGIIIGGGLTNINLGFISRAGESDYFSSKKIGIDFLEGVLLAKFLNYINTGLKHLPINKFMDFSYKTKAILESNACISSFNNACSGDEMDSQGWGLLLISILLSYF